MNTNSKLLIRQDPYSGTAGPGSSFGPTSDPYSSGYPYSQLSQGGIVPYNFTQPAQPAAPSKSGFSFNDLKGMVDRMGGINGIMDKVGQAQKVFQNFQQMAPMFKLLAGSFLSKAAVAKSGSRRSSKRRKTKGRKTAGRSRTSRTRRPSSSRKSGRRRR